MPSSTDDKLSKVGDTFPNFTLEVPRLKMTFKEESSDYKLTLKQLRNNMGMVKLLKFS